MKIRLLCLIFSISINASANDISKSKVIDNLRFVEGLNDQSKEKVMDVFNNITITNSGDSDDEATQTRIKAVKQEAFNYGLDNGIFYRGQEISSLYEKHNSSLQRIFNFNRFIMNGNILLPKVSVGRRLFDQMNSKMVRRVNASFKLKSDAELVPNAPDWREYLVRNYPEPEQPHHALRPKDNNELAIFKASFIRGWEAGVIQANMISDRDWIKLTSDYEAHLDFSLLASQNIMSYPTMTKESLSIYKTDGGKTLLVGDVIAEISTDSAFNNSGEWTTFFTNSGSN